MRISLAIEYGVEVAERFRAIYLGTAGQDGHHPYWDLLDAADMILDMPVPQTQAVADGYSRFEHWTAIALASV